MRTPRPGADLEHDVAGLELGEAPDDAEDVLVDQEVLAERLLRDDVHSPNAAVGVGVDLRLELAPRPRRVPRRASASVCMT